MNTEIGHNVFIGDNNKIGAMCFLPENVIIGNGCFIGPRVTFTNDLYPPSGRENWLYTVVKNKSSIGAGSIILPGIVIGSNSLIGAGSVVTKHVPNGEVWAGNPAKFIRKREDGDWKNKEKPIVIATLDNDSHIDKKKENNKEGEEMNDIENCEILNEVDENGNPTGGSVTGVGIDINWQSGPLGRGEERAQPNGAFVETVISAAKQRVEFYQTASDGKFACQENLEAIRALERALMFLEKRTERRESEGTEGTHNP